MPPMSGPRSSGCWRSIATAACLWRSPSCRRRRRRRLPTVWPASRASICFSMAMRTSITPRRDDKKIELGTERPAMLVLGELGTGRMALERLFGARPLPVLVPPWNRIAPALVPTLPEIGFRWSFDLRCTAPHASGEGAFGGQHPRRFDRLEGRPRLCRRGRCTARACCRFGPCARVRRARGRSQSPSCDGRRGVGFPKVDVAKITENARTSRPTGT